MKPIRAYCNTQMIKTFLSESKEACKNMPDSKYYVYFLGRHFPDGNASQEKICSNASGAIFA